MPARNAELAIKCCITQLEQCKKGENTVALATALLQCHGLGPYYQISTKKHGAEFTRHHVGGQRGATGHMFNDSLSAETR